MNELISIIVPVYNVEHYLDNCVGSILNQTYKNLEIILVDDGSPDRCGIICDEYEQKDSRIKVIHKQNGGLSDARNAGMKIMTGQYVAFVDSDDWIEPHMYETLYGLMKQFDADMAFGGVADDYEKNGVVTTMKTSNYCQLPFVEGKIEAMRRYFHGSWAAWDKLYKSDLFKNIEYPVGEINEDEAIVLHLLDRCKQVCYTNEVLYHYMKRDSGTSITTASFSEKKMAWVKHCNANLKYIKETHPELIADAYVRYGSSLIWSMQEIGKMQTGMSESWKQLRKELKRDFSSLWKYNKNTKKRIWMVLLSIMPRTGIYRLISKRSHI